MLLGVFFLGPIAFPHNVVFDSLVTSLASNLKVIDVGNFMFFFTINDNWLGMWLEGAIFSSLLSRYEKRSMEDRMDVFQIRRKHKLECNWTKNFLNQIETVALEGKLC